MKIVNKTTLNSIIKKNLSSICHFLFHTTVLSWFTLVESTFNRYDVVDSRLRFDLILLALPEEVIEQIRGVLCAVEHLDRPYVDLKARLLQLFTPKPTENCLKLIYGAEEAHPAHGGYAGLTLSWCGG